MKSHPFLKPIILLVFMVMGTWSYGQSNKSLDHSRRVLEKHYPFPNNHTELHEKFRDAFVAYRLNQIQEADSIKKVYQSIKVSYSEVDSAIYYFLEGHEFYNKFDYDQAAKYFSKSKFLFDKNDRISSGLYVKYKLTNILYFLKKVKFAYNAYLEIALHDSCPIFLKGLMYNNLGAISLEIDTLGLPDDYNNSKDNRIEKIENFFRKSVELQREIDNQQGIAATYSVWVNLLIVKQDLDAAYAMIDSCVNIAKRFEDKDRIAFARIKTGILLDIEGRYQEAIDTLQWSIDYFEEIGNYDQKIHSLGKVYASQIFLEDFKGASATALGMYESLRDNVGKNVSDAITKYETQYKTAEKELKIKDQEIDIANRNRWLIIGGMLTLLIGLLFLLFYQRKRRTMQKEQDALIIKHKDEGLKAIIYAQEEERKRIAKDLHDGIVQQLGGLKIGFQNKFSKNKDEESEKLLNVLDDSVQELRNLSHRMMPKALGELGLIPAIEDMLENSLGHTDIKFDFEHYNLDKRIAENIEISIYRIAQELVNNVIKHSSASQVHLQLFKAGNNVIFIVEDNGEGFDTSINTKGIGLMNIASRLDTIHGQVNYEPSPVSGTLVTIKIPLD